MSTPVERLDSVIQAKARWITSRLRRVQSAGAAPTAREFVSGESFLYLGRQYRLAVRRGREANVLLEHGRFRICVPPARNATSRAEAVKARLVAWYREHATQRLTERVAWWSRRVGVAVPRVLIRDQEKRWGSCSRGVVRFNWRIVQAPTRLLDYVVVHELVHLLHDDHGTAFWTQLGRVLPDYEIRREELRRVGALLNW